MLLSKVQGVAEAECRAAAQTSAEHRLVKTDIHSWKLTELWCPLQDVEETSTLSVSSNFVSMFVSFQEQRGQEEGGWEVGGLESGLSAHLGCAASI